MDETTAIFILMLLSIASVAVIILAWIKHRAPGKTGAGALETRREVELLTSENAGLKGQIGRLEERLSVLERIATDPAERTAREIENLRQS